jgi:hypothetical protein
LGKDARDFAALHLADDALFIHQVKLRPYVVAVSPSGSGRIVLKDRPGDAFSQKRLLNVLKRFVGRELGGVDTDDLETVLGILVLPPFQGREAAIAVVTRVDPYVNQDDLAAQVLDS